MKRALVTGGASALGQAICHRLAADGLHVIVHAHAAIDRAHAIADEIRASGGAAQAWQCDLTDMATTATALEALLAQGVVQVVVHNAGIHDDAPMAGMSAQQWRGVVSVSLDGFFATVQPLLLPMIGTRWGRVSALSSVAAIMGNRGQANYAAAKAGHFTRQ